MFLSSSTSFTFGSLFLHQYLGGLSVFFYFFSYLVIFLFNHTGELFHHIFQNHEQTVDHITLHNL